MCNSKIEVLYDLTIQEFLYLIGISYLVISCDTGPFLFAVALKTKFIVIFGNTPFQYVIGNMNIVQNHEIMVSKIIKKDNDSIEIKFPSTQEVYNAFRLIEEHDYEKENI